MIEHQRIMGKEAVDNNKPVVICLNLRMTFAVSTSTQVFYPRVPSETKWNDEYWKTKVTDIIVEVELDTRMTTKNIFFSINTHQNKQNIILTKKGITEG